VNDYGGEMDRDSRRMERVKGGGSNVQQVPRKSEIAFYL
jgi:hypothetical protein